MFKKIIVFLFLLFENLHTLLADYETLGWRVDFGLDDRRRLPALQSVRLTGELASFWPHACDMLELSLEVLQHANL